MLYAIALVEDKRMRFQGLDTAFVLVLVLAALSACATSQPVTQSQPTTDASMPGMNHGAMSQPSSQVQPTSPANMPGMQQVPAAQTEDGHTMAPVNGSDTPAAAPDTGGNQPLEPKLVDGVRESKPTTNVIEWNILPDVQIGAVAYNSQVPGSLIRVNDGDNANCLCLDVVTLISPLSAAIGICSRHARLKRPHRSTVTARSASTWV